MDEMIGLRLLFLGALVGGCAALDESAGGDAGGTGEGGVDSLRGVSFAKRVPYQVGSSPIAALAADLNGDRFLDVAVALADSADGRIAILWGRADGTLSPRESYRSGDTPYAIAASDLNGDGRLDLLAPSYLGANLALHIQRAGAFPLASTHPVGAHPLGVSVVRSAMAGPVTVLVANQVGRSLSMLSGPADGNLPLRSDVDLFGIPLVQTIVDLNQDGLLDVVVGMTEGLVFLQGAGLNPMMSAFGFAAPAKTPINGHVVGLQAVEGTQGNEVAILARREGVTEAQLYLAKYQGMGLVVREVEGGLLKGDPSALTAADFNADGWIDLAVAQRGSGQVQVLLQSASSYRDAGIYPVGARPSSIGAVDLNLDGKPDLVITDQQDGTLSVLLNTSD